MTDLDQATKILENIKAEVDEVEKLLLSGENEVPEAAPAAAPSFEAEAKPEGSITSKLLNTFNTIKENVEAVIPTKTSEAPEAPAVEVPQTPEAPVPEVPAAEAPEIPEAPAPAPVFEAPEPAPAPVAPVATETSEAPEAEATAPGGSASENALNAILGASAELPSQAKNPAPAPEEPTPAPAPNEG